MKFLINKSYTNTLVVVLCLAMASCKLDLVPLDYYGSGSYWTKEADIVAYMDGMHNHLRSHSYQHQYIMGEVRGGSLVTGTTSNNVATEYNALKIQNITESSPGITNWGNIYGRIFNCNFFIQKTLQAKYMPEEKKGFYLGQAYGLRAFYYFDLYRTYGGVPLILEPKVTDGVIEPDQLYTERSSPLVVMKQIKADLEESLKYFGTTVSFDPLGRGFKKSQWSKAATETLKGEVYLWTSKVSTGDDLANEADLSVAKQAFTSVMNNYGLSLLPDFAKVFSAQSTDKGNAEVIMAVRYAEGEATNNANRFAYNLLNGFLGQWKGDNGELYTKDTLQIQATGLQYNEFKPALLARYNKQDFRRNATFLPLFDRTDATLLRGTILRKNIGYNNAAGVRIWCGDEIIYRLPFVYLSLAEIENMQGGDPAKYINMVRKRAYGSNWNESVFGYTNGNFTQNELAILQEKDKEFVNEGQRWWDVRRMTLTKGGKHLVFVPEGSIGDNLPILNEATEAYKVLWPIETNMLNKDPLLKQTPGYQTAKP